MKNEKLFVFLLLVFLFLFSRPIFADSSYVLPYPSFMPGSKMYAVHLLWDELMRHWYFGDFGKFTYNLNQSDKYLVEAKTLFEYKQYLLGYKALKKSDEYFIKIAPVLKHAQEQKKDTSKKKLILLSAAKKHIEALELIKRQIPEEFVWQPEKQSPLKLDLRNSLDHAINIRNNML